MKNRLIIGLCLLFSLKALAMQLTDSDWKKIHDGEFNIYFNDQYRSLVGYGSAQLAYSFNVPEEMPFVDAWIEKKDNKKSKVLIHIPLVMYLKKKGEQHQSKYLTINCSWEYAIAYHYKSFVNPKPSLLAVSKNQLLQDLIDKKIIRQEEGCEYYGHGEKGYPSLLGELREKREQNEKIGYFELLLSYDDECSKKESYYPYSSAIYSLWEPERLNKLKIITP